MEAIVAEWEEFASTLFSSRQQMTSLALRDHVKEIMEAVVTDIRAAQSKEQQTAKSKGHAPKILEAPETAAQTHGVLRARCGLNINQLVSEYRALRASVLRLWEESGEIDPQGFQDMIRFNEAIDQALSESVDFFAAKVEESRNLLLGALGHDMRSPLQAILLTARNLARSNTGLDLPKAAERLVRSGAAIQSLLEDLIDFSRANLGQGTAVEPQECDIGLIFADEVEQQRVAHPGARIDLTVEGEVRAKCDARRLQQVLRNLITNAIAYGFQGTPVTVSLKRTTVGISFSVTNRGQSIDRNVLTRLFDPLKRGLCDEGQGADRHMGIGLYIVREIALAHGGEVQVQSEADETRFTVNLPRDPAR